MIKNHLGFLVLLMFFFTSILFSQDRNLWSRISESGISDSELQHLIKLEKFESFELNSGLMRNALKDAPKRKVFIGRSNTKIQFPDENGKMETFLIKESSVMDPILARKFPENKSYVGFSEKDASKRIHFSMNELGLNAMILDAKGGVRYIEPLSRDSKKYRIYDRHDIEDEWQFECFTQNVERSLKSGLALKVVDDRKLRTYKMALAGTGEYAQFHIEDQNAQGLSDPQKKGIVLAVMTTAITRINAVFENDLAISLQLVSNNDELIYLDPDNDPYTNNDPGVMLGENQINCDAVIGSENYDLGHVLASNLSSIDGVAVASAVCQSGIKARGVSGSSFPKGDFFHFNVLAHEIGHQYGAKHTFNGDAGSCGQDGQRNADTAIEPGSGSTLMAYAGLCASQNVQSESDLYFHVISIEEMRNYILNPGGGSCATISDLSMNLNTPIVDAGSDFIIPRSTPFKLVGSGSDADGDPITFGWEQVDNEITAIPPSETATGGAVYRSYNPSENPVRIMPKLSTLVTGSISSTWEVTPSVGRDLNFKLTVRDNNSEAGQVVSDDLKVTVSDAAGPFAVTSQNTEELEWTPGEEETITWDVAGTTSNNINVSQVNILLSTDGGLTFTTTLASGVANDGSHVITVPDSKSPQCFVIVEAVGNFFFSMNLKSFSIGAFNEICNNYDSEDTPVAIPDNNSNGVTSTILINEDVVIEDLKINLKINHSSIGDLKVLLESPEGIVVELLKNSCDFFDPDIDVVFSLEGNPLTCFPVSPTIRGVIQPIGDLNDIISQSSLGQWQLKVIDEFAVDEGFIEAWSIEICSSEPVLGVNNYVFDEFVVFPNPSDGRFKVKFRSEETSDVEILIYDLLGRKIVNRNFKNVSNRFEEIIDTQDIAGGIYILSVKRGNKMSSQKIRIK